MSYTSRQRQRGADQDAQHRAARIRERREQADLRAVCQTAEGRRFIGRLLDAGGLFAQSFTGGSDTFFNEGKRAFAVAIYRDLEALDPSGALFIQCRRDAALALEADAALVERGSSQ